MTSPNPVRSISAPVDTLTLRVLHEAPLQDLLLSRIDVVLHMPYKHNTLLQ